MWSSPSPRPFDGERVGVRGSYTPQRQLLPLTLTLSPQAGRGYPTNGKRERECYCLVTLPFSILTR
jgi:hypothetical protein